MIGFTAWWLPTLLSAVAVFLVSSLIHMVLPWHRNDYPKLANEDAILDALRPLAIPKGDYMLPRPSGRGDMRSPEFAEKLKRGPVLVMTVWPGGSMSMARNLIGWFVYALVVGWFAGHITAVATSSGAQPVARYVIFHTVGLSAWLGYSAALWQMSIWYRRSWMTTVKATVDGLIYAGITAGIFAWLWPR